MGIDKKLSSTLMVANLLATIFVVAIHYGSADNIAPAKIWGWNHLFQQFMLNGIARTAVPFFALIAGFFMAYKLSKDTKFSILYNKFKTLFVPYILAGALILVLTIAFKSFLFGYSYPLSWYRVFKDILLQPISVQFWFLRDLILLTLIALILPRLRDIWYLFLLVPLGIMWFIDYQPFPIVFQFYLLNIETLFFFLLGMLLFSHKEFLYRIINASTTHKVIIAILWFGLLAARIFVDPTIDVWYVKKYTLTSVMLYKLAILIGVYSLIQLSVYISNNRFVIYLSGLTFFVYLFHFLPFYEISLLSRHLVPRDYMFYLNFPILLVVIFSLGHLTSKFLPAPFALLTGGRDPRKTLKRVETA